MIRMMNHKDQLVKVTNVAPVITVLMANLKKSIALSVENLDCGKEII